MKLPAAYLVLLGLVSPFLPSPDSTKLPMAAVMLLIGAAFLLCNRSLVLDGIRLTYEHVFAFGPIRFVKGGPVSDFESFEIRSAQSKWGGRSPLYKVICLVWRQGWLPPFGLETLFWCYDDRAAETLTHWRMLVSDALPKLEPTSPLRVPFGRSARYEFPFDDQKLG